MRIKFAYPEFAEHVGSSHDEVFLLTAVPSSVLDRSSVKTEYVKVWGGPHGGATPDYQGQGVATNFLGSADGDADDSGALYYPNAMEQTSLACMEMSMSAIGARAVSKLLARRLGLIESTEAEPTRDEL